MNAEPRTPSAEGYTFMRHSMILGLGDALSMGLGFITTIVVTDVLGQQFGLLLGAQRFTNFFLVIAQFGLTPYLIRSIAAKREAAGALLGDVLLLRLLLGLLFSAVVVAAAALTGHMPEYLWLIALWAAIEAVGALAETNSAACQGLERMGLSSLILLARSVPNVIGVLLVAKLGGGLLELVLVYLASRVIQLVAALGISFAVLGPRSVRFDPGRIPPLVQASFPYLGIIVGYGIFSTVDVILLTRIAGAPEVARYGAAMNFLATLFIFQLIGQKALLPMFSRLSGSTSVAGIGRNTLHAFSMLAFPAAYGLSVLAEPIIALYPSGEFGSSAIVLRVLGLSFVFSALASVMAAILTGAGRIRAIVQAYVLTITLQIALNWWLASRFGAPGTAAATVLSYAIMAACLLRPTLDVIRWFPLAAMARHAVAAAVMAAVVHALRQLPLPLSITAGMIVFALVLLSITPAGGMERRVLRLGLGRLRRKSVD